MVTDEGAGHRWREQRQRAITVHAEAQRRRREAEARQARELIGQFTREASEQGLRSAPLYARAFNGRARYRTRLHGWYLKPDLSLAVSTTGDFYILTVPASLRARFAGARLVPEQPPLTVGEGARDGESVPLRTLLRMRLDAGDAWP